jgi:DNA-directed RNA polymerase specialized sigma24 family protein
MIATDPGRRQALAAFYSANHRSIERIVAHAASERSGAGVADACAIAWLKLVGRDDVTLDQRGASWVATVAIHEAWREGRFRRVSERPTGGFREELADCTWLARATSDPLDRVLELEDHHERRTALGTAKPNEREALFLHALGHRYAEIMELTGASYTSVNRRISEGRRRVRQARQHARLASEADDQSGSERMFV